MGALLTEEPDSFGDQDLARNPDEPEPDLPLPAQVDEHPQELPGKVPVWLETETHGAKRRAWV